MLQLRRQGAECSDSSRVLAALLAVLLEPELDLFEDGAFELRLKLREDLRGRV